MKERPRRPVPQRYIVYAATFEFPLTSQKVVVNNYDVNFGTGTIRVRARRDINDTKRMIAIIRDETNPVYNEPMPPKLAAVGNVQAGYTELMQEGNTDFFRSDSVPVLGLPAMSPVANNKRVFIGSYDGNNDRMGVDSVRFMAFPGVFPIVVDARCCLWLAFAEDAAVLPQGEQPPEYRPVGLLVPDKDGLNATITRVNLQARNLATDRWQKGPDPLLITNADGLVGSEADLADPNYKTGGNVHSGNITGGAFRKGHLVILWDDGTQTAAEVGVGLTNPTQNVPGGQRPTKLHLGFHDGVEWVNNTGSVVVQVRWQT